MFPSVLPHRVQTRFRRPELPACRPELPANYCHLPENVVEDSKPSENKEASPEGCQRKSMHNPGEHSRPCGAANAHLMQFDVPVFLPITWHHTGAPDVRINTEHQGSEFSGIWANFWT